MENVLSNIASMFFSEIDVTHTPVSSVKPEEMHKCNIVGICCSKDGVVYAADQGFKKIYRIETETGNCISFGKYLGNITISFNFQLQLLFPGNPKDIEI